MTTLPSDEALLRVRETDLDWWRQAAVYQIYPRSFADSDGDGIGDLPGITSRIPYLKSLDIDAVWLSPFYPSALADGGYDIDDYRDVDPRLGTLADFDTMASALHEAQIKLIVDIVPNHSSNRHRWFREAIASPAGSRARERYIFRDGLGPSGELPPSNWESVFGGPAWQRIVEPSGEPGQWYLHLFAPEQPDLNWDSPDVREDFLTTLRFWADRGVDGFRIDVAHGLVKDLTEPLVPLIRTVDLDDPRMLDGTHPLWDRDAVHDIYADWRRLFNEYDPPRIAVAEAWVHPTRRASYANAEGLGQAFNFDLVEADFNARDFRRVIEENLREASAAKTSSTWVLSNHDVLRHATRYGLPAEPDRRLRERARQSWLRSSGASPRPEAARGLRRARAATLLMLALPGSAYLYQGEELGLPEVAGLPDAARSDPTFRRSAGADPGRDGCRVPLPWTASAPYFGFSTAASHLPQPDWFSGFSVEAEAEDPASTLNLYRRALELRRELRTSEELAWIGDPDPAVIHFARPNGWHCITNFGTGPVPLPEGRVLLLSSADDRADRRLAAESTAWIRIGGPQR